MIVDLLILFAKIFGVLLLAFVAILAYKHLKA